jgi:hypothetical protein
MVWDRRRSFPFAWDIQILSVLASVQLLEGVKTHHFQPRTDGYTHSGRGIPEEVLQVLLPSRQDGDRHLTCDLDCER